GRLLRGTLALVIGDRNATRIAVFLGRVAALAMAAAAAAYELYLLIAVAAFLFHASGRETLDPAAPDPPGAQP
ncbi:MAG: hypothetical protein JXQ29_08480, partial [Planctomycetes bacterium]|nr:hypothetical protein [Planctomycetota bacterium]